MRIVFSFCKKKHLYNVYIPYLLVFEAVFRCKAKLVSVQSDHLWGWSLVRGGHLWRVVTYGGWGGRLREVVATKELTLVSNSTLLNVKNITRLIDPIRWSV